MGRRSSNRGSTPKDVDQLVLGTTNAPYRRTINSTDLAARLTSRDWQNWIAHVVTFFTEVRPELVLQFARLHAIPIKDLAAAYRSMKSVAGETNPTLERAFERRRSLLGRTLYGLLDLEQQGRPVPDWVLGGGTASAVWRRPGRQEYKVANTITSRRVRVGDRSIKGELRRSSQTPPPTQMEPASHRSWGCFYS